jgi:hypothetical protein
MGMGMGQMVVLMNVMNVCDYLVLRGAGCNARWCSLPGVPGACSAYSALMCDVQHDTSRPTSSLPGSMVSHLFLFKDSWTASAGVAGVLHQSE